MIEEISLGEVSSQIKKYGYSSIKIYTKGTQVKFIQLNTNLQRKPFLLQLSHQYSMNSTRTDHILTEIQGNYRSFRQEKYLTKIPVHNIACLSDTNLVVKNNQSMTGYLIDSILEDSDSELDDNSDDIEVDDFPVKEIYPVFDLQNFLKNISDFEEQVILNYSTIYKSEEEINEQDVEKLLLLFENQKKHVKEQIYQLHQNTYNTRRDIVATGDKLLRLYKIKRQSESAKDNIRFEIDRLSLEIESQIDILNNNLSKKRDEADKLINVYIKYINSFSSL